MKKKDKKKVIAKLLYGIWDSMETHIYYMNRKSWEGRRWHARCVKRYIDLFALVKELF